MNKAHGIFFKDNRFLKISSSELLFDIVLFLYVKGFLYSVVSRGEMIYQAISFNCLVYIGSFVVFFITWYTGFLATRLSHWIKNKNLLIIPTVLFIWIPTSMLAFIDQNLMGISGGTMTQIHHSWNFLGTFVGILSGGIFGFTEYDVEDGKSELISRLMALTLIIPLLFVYLGFHLALRKDYYPFIIWALAIVSYLGLFKLTAKLDDNKEHPVGLFYHVFRAYIFPFIIIAILCLWQELFIWGKINGALMKQTTLTIPGMLGYLVITGIIPIRVIMALQPPITFLGIVTGLGSISYFFYSVVKLVTNIFG